jgi:hypothetical protein
VCCCSGSQLADVDLSLLCRKRDEEMQHLREELEKAKNSEKNSRSCSIL